MLTEKGSLDEHMTPVIYNTVIHNLDSHGMTKHVGIGNPRTKHFKFECRSPSWIDSGVFSCIICQICGTHLTHSTPNKTTMERRKTLGHLRFINGNMIIHFANQSQTCQLLKIKKKIQTFHEKKLWKVVQIQGWGQISICICKYKYGVFVFVFDQISNHVFVFDPPYLVYLTNTFSNTLFPGPFSKHKFMENRLTWIFFINMLKSALLFQNKCRGLILLIPIGGCVCALDYACQWVCDKPLA